MTCSAKFKILLVDDSPSNIDILIEALGDDYVISVALNGVSAIDSVKNNMPDIILLDIIMPEMDGFEVARRLKTDPEFKDIPIIFITAIDEIENKTAGFELGAVDYMTKPFEILEVKSRVKTHLSLKIARQKLAKQNAQLRHSLSLAKEVQQNLIPSKDPVFDGFDIAGKIIYCDETGGDYYDYIETVNRGSEQLGIVVGDVSEHGIPSALLMTTARAFIRFRASLPGSLAQIVSDVNKLLTADVKDSGRFMTLLFFFLDSQRKCVSWVRAGHDPAIIFDREKDVFYELNNKGGLPLGLFPDTKYLEYRHDIKQGQIIILFTDGLWEAHDASGKLFGKDRIKNIIRSHAQESAQSIIYALIDAIKNFRGDVDQEDDMTVVIIKT